MPNRTRVKLMIEIDLDPVPGTFNTKESAQEQVQRIMNDAVKWYNPTVTIVP